MPVDRIQLMGIVCKCQLCPKVSFYCRATAQPVTFSWNRTRYPDPVPKFITRFQIQIIDTHWAVLWNRKMQLGHHNQQMERQANLAACLSICWLWWLNFDFPLLLLLRSLLFSLTDVWLRYRYTDIRYATNILWSRPTWTFYMKKTYSFVEVYNNFDLFECTCHRIVVCCTISIFYIKLLLLVVVVFPYLFKSYSLQRQSIQ